MLKKWRTLTRIEMLSLLLLLLMAGFVGRLFWLQIIKHHEYVDLAKRVQRRNFVIPAQRGKIYMFDNQKAVPVVLNQIVYEVVADPVIIDNEDISKITQTIRDVAGGEMVSGIEQKLANKKSRYEVLARNITRSQAEKIKKNNLAGVSFIRKSIRNYPEGQLAAQVLGFVNQDGEGQYGVEQGLNDRLQGRDGLLQSLADVQNVPLIDNKDNVRIEPKAGEDIVLSIDRNIQSYSEEALERGVKNVGATEGSVLVMNPQNGQVLAMANYPTFSLQDYGTTKDSSVFVNNITMLPFEPASVIKSFTMATGLDQQKISPSTTYYNSGCIQVLDRSMCNASSSLNGQNVTMQDALNNSLNVGTISAMRQLGDGKHINRQARNIMYDYFHNKFGLGKRTGIEIAEAAGSLYSPDKIEGNEVRYSTMTFGQGFSATMIQVAAAFSSLINGGEYYQPTLIAGKMEHDLTKTVKHQPIRQTISTQTSKQITDMLVAARRFAWFSKGDKSNYKIGGKTGTAETIASDGRYTKKETVATYIGFGGTTKPEYVIMIRVAAPNKGLNLEGGMHAGPIFTEISNWIIDYKKIAPRSL